MHLKPAVGKPRPVGEAIVEHLFGPRDDGRIPVVGITGTQGTADIAMLLGSLLQRAGQAAGVACSDGLFVQMQPIDTFRPSDWEAGQRILMNRCVDAAVLENSPRSILDDGLSYDRCLVGVVTDVPEPTGLQDHHILTREQMRTVLRTQVDVVLPQGCAVLNADDDVCASLAELSDGDVIFYSVRPDHPLRAEHCDTGRRFLLVQDGKVMLWRNHSATPLLELDHPVVARLLAERLSLPALMAATAAALALDLYPALVRAGIESADPVSRT
jgi:cyanophycin synthetase